MSASGCSIAEPARIARQLARRDQNAEADSFSLFLDAHHDHVTGATFSVSAAGVQRDATIYNDSWTDDSWDAVWASAVKIDDTGWVAEMRIPYSQLRFSGAAQLTFGINAMRYIQRKKEEAWLVHVPKTESGLASRMGHLDGLDGVAPRRTVELIPYVVTRAEYVEPEDGDPFNDGARAFAGTGVDLEYRMTSSLSLDGTVNPDFGQVEVDPAVVNLTAFETFFEEKRPFFIEGAEHLQQLRPRRGEQLLGLQPRGTAAVLLTPDRPRAAGQCKRRFRRATDRDDDPRRREAHGQDPSRLERRHARCGDRPRMGDRDYRRRECRDRGRAALQLHESAAPRRSLDAARPSARSRPR